jgi:hypothetical protein
MWRGLAIDPVVLLLSLIFLINIPAMLYVHANAGAPLFRLQEHLDASLSRRRAQLEA